MRKRLEEMEYLDFVAQEMDLQYVADRAAHLDKQRQLLESWERDGHIRNLKKLQEKGSVRAVSDYVDRNLSDALPLSARPSSQLMSIGFDPRKSHGHK